jgi:uncharacterized protein YycO
MKIHYLFSRRNKIGSKLIAWGSKYENLGIEELPSHTAILMNDKLVVESVLGKGVRIVPYNNWKKINEEMYKIPCSQEVRSSKEITDEVERIWGKKYDWRGILFFAWSFIKLILFKTKLPEKNEWQRDGYFFCSELVGRISGVNYEMTTPAKLLKTMLGKK